MAGADFSQISLFSVLCLLFPLYSAWSQWNSNFSCPVSPENKSAVSFRASGYRIWLALYIHSSSFHQVPHLCLWVWFVLSDSHPCEASGGETGYPYLVPHWGTNGSLYSSAPAVTASLITIFLNIIHRGFSSTIPHLLCFFGTLHLKKYLHLRSFEEKW